jgi:hypothetical protein
MTPRTARLAVGASTLMLFAALAQAGLGAFGSEAAPAAPLVSSAPLRPNVSTRATFAFDRLPGLEYECALDDGTYAPCSSPVTFAGLTRSAHTFRVRARKPEGAASRPSAYPWTIVVPARRTSARAGKKLRPTFTTAPVLPWISRNATFAWLLRPSTKAQCRLDDGRWRGCVGPRTYLALDLGRHVFRLRARGSRGRRSSVNLFVWTIGESPAPTPPTISSGPNGNTTSTEATFSFAVDEGDAAECRLDGGAWLACSSVAMYVGLGVGSHIFCVRAVSGSGVTSAETCATWTVLASPSVPEPSGPFTISGTIPGALAPGATRPLPLTISNPFDFGIRVTSLTVTVRPGSTQAGCDGPTNLSITQSNTAGGSVSVVVPRRGSVTLPAQGATTPAVTMLDLPTDQEACKGASFSVASAGSGVKS